MTRIDGSTNANGEVRNFNPYQRGRRFEYKTQNYLRKEGCYVIRQPRSMFPDLIAFRNDGILLIECRVHGYIAPEERRKIGRLARSQVGGRQILAFRRERKILFQLLSTRSAKHDRLLSLDEFDKRSG